MLETYLVIKPAIDHTISKNPEEFSNILLNDSDITTIREILKVLKPFLYTSTELQKEKEPIFAISHLSITALYQHIKELIESSNNNAIKAGLKKGLAKLQKYFPQDHGANIYDIYAYSIILDPRFKLQFLQKRLGYSATNINFIKQRFRRLFDIYSLRYKDFNKSNLDLEDDEEINKNKSYQDQLLDKFIEDSSDEENTLFFGQTELDLYYAETRVNKDTNIIDYWKLKGAEYPILAFIARDFLSIMATSAPIEREFSKLSDIANNKKRNRLSALRINQLISLKSWANIKEEEYKIEEDSSSDSELD